nr:TIR domain-containing protein [Paenibacillus xylanexedens]
MLKVFLSWSGDISKKIALVFREWLPSVIQEVEPYVSSEDIDKGARWSSDIAKELSESSYGILCVTPQNISAPWLNFEAGALSKAIDKSFVSPFLFGMKRAEVKGPTLQFQSTLFEKNDIKKLVYSINAACGQNALEEARLEKIFDVWWPRLEEELLSIDKELVELQSEQTKLTTQVTNTVNGNEQSMIEEILELTRAQQKKLNNPEELLPPSYVEWLLRQNGRDFEHPAFEDLVSATHKFEVLLEKYKGQSEVPINEIHEIFNELEKPARFIMVRQRELFFESNRRRRVNTKKVME